MIVGRTWRSARTTLGWILLGALSGAGGCPEWDFEPACVHVEVRDAEAVEAGSVEGEPGSGELPFFEAVFVGGQPGPFGMRGFDPRALSRFQARGLPERRGRNFGDVYLDAGFDEAMRIARESERWLIVRFGTEWSVPTLQLDEAMNTLPVREWVVQNAYAIAIDAEVESDLAREQDILFVPTLVLYRDGEEWAASTGYLPSMDPLRWLVRATQGTQNPRERTEASVPARIGEAHAEERASDPVWQAYTRAEHALREKRYDDAFEDMLGLWREGAELTPSFRGVRVSFFARDMQQLARVHPPALEAFDGLRREAQQAVVEGVAGDDVVRDWFVLSEVVASEHRILAWYDSVRDADGRLPTEFANVVPRLVDLLLKHGRRADAGRLIDDVDERVEVLIEGWPHFLRPESFAQSVSWVGDYEWARLTRGSVRNELASLHGTLLAAGRWQDAGRVADTLLGELDDVPTRARLVEEAMAVRVVLPCHDRWLDEALDWKLSNPSARPGPLDGNSDPQPDLRLLDARLKMIKASILEEQGPS